MTPCAGDVTSGGVAAQLSSGITAINHATAAANLAAGAAASRLNNTADAYHQQDVVSAATLGDTAGTAAVPATLMRDLVG